jgi:anti-anti-sigma factor
MDLHNDMILLWGLSLDAWITIATVITIITVMLLTKVRTDAVMLIAISVLFITGVLDAKEMCSGSVLTVVLGEELATANAPALMEELIPFKDQGVEKVVFDAKNLTHLSSSGIRVIIYCKQKLCVNPEIVFLNCNEDILDVLDIVGIRSFITFEE